VPFELKATRRPAGLPPVAPDICSGEAYCSLSISRREAGEIETLAVRAISCGSRAMPDRTGSLRRSRYRVRLQRPEDQE